MNRTHLSTSQPPLSKGDNPYIGPRNFEDNERERRLFFGRDREAADLLSLVLAERLVLFYAPSGAGKSSLLNARLLPGLRTEGFTLLGRVRVGGQLPQSIALESVANIYIFNILRDIDRGQTSFAEMATLRLPDYLAMHAADSEQPDRILIIDQFEEIVTTYPGQWEKREDFFRQINQALADDPHLWIVLTMREDYIAELDPYARLVPGRLRVRYRMQYMGYQAALEAVKQPAALEGHPFDAGVAETLVNNLRQMAGQQTDAEQALGEYIEPVQLQVVCLQLWENLHNQPGATITLADVENLARGAGLGEFVNHALGSFYEQVLATVLATQPGESSEREVRDWFSNVLITRDGTRNLIYQSETETGGMSNAIVLELERRFLLRAETRTGGRWIELVHDRLVRPIQAANQQWRKQQPLILAAEMWIATRDATQLLSSAQLTEAQAQLAANPNRFGPQEYEFVARSAEAEAERRTALEAEAEQRRIEEQQRREEAARNRTVAIGAVVAAVIMAALLVISIWLGWQAFITSLTAQRASAEAEVQRAFAQQRAREAEEAKSRANASAAEAATRAREADLARQEAEQLSQQIRSDQLAGQAVLALESNPQRALLLAVEALRPSTDRAALLSHGVEQGIHDVLHATGGMPIPAGDDYATALTISPDARWVALANESGQILQWQLDRPDTPPIELATTGEPIVWALAGSSQGELAAVDEAGTIRVWPASHSGADPQQLQSGGAPLFSVTFTPDAQAVVAGGRNGALYIWLFNQPEIAPLVLQGHTDAVTVVAASPDGRWLASGSADNRVLLWPVDRLDSPLLVATHDAPISVLDFSNDATTLASGDNSGGVQMYDLEILSGAAERLPDQSGRISAMDFSVNGRWLATGDENGVVRLWNLDNPSLGYPVRAHESIVSGLAYVVGTDGEKLVSTGYDGAVRLWDYRMPGTAPVTVRGHDGVINLLGAAPAVNGFVTAGYDRMLRIWGISSPQAEPTTVAASTPFVDDLAMVQSPATLYASGITSNAVGIWDIGQGITPRSFARMAAANVTSLAAAASGALVATGSSDGVIQLWENNSDTLIGTLSGHHGQINGLAFSPDGTLLASAGDDNTVRLWDTNTLQEIGAITEHSAPVLAAAFSPDGSQLASTGRDGQVLVWETGTLVSVRRFSANSDGFSSVAFSGDGRQLAAGGLDKLIYLWDMADPDAAPHLLRGHTNEVNTILFPNGQSRLVSASADRSLRLWNTDEATAIPVVLSGHRASVNALAYAQGALLSAGTDGTIRRWALRSSDLAAIACQVAGRNFYGDEWEIYFPAEACRVTCAGLPDLCAETAPKH